MVERVNRTRQTASELNKMALCGASHLADKKNLDLASEQMLVAQCLRQDAEGFSRIVDAYQARLLGFVRRMVKNEEEALDVTQETFIRAFRNLDKFDGRSSVRTWLFRIAHNLCIDRARRQGRRVVEMSLEPQNANEETIDVADARWDPERHMLEQEFADLVETAIATMSEKLRLVLLLHDKEDLGYDEIAKVADIPVGTVKSRLFLARAHVKSTIEQYQRSDRQVSLK